jgi:hypothetical protein
MGRASVNRLRSALRAMVKHAVRCYFDETMEAPQIIRLHFVRDEALA